MLAEVKSILILVAYWGVAKFSNNETKRGDNSYEDREHGAMLNGRELGLPELNSGNRTERLAILYDI